MLEHRTTHICLPRPDSNSEIMPSREQQCDPKIQNRHIIKKRTFAGDLELRSSEFYRISCIKSDNLFVGITEIIVSGGMTMPQRISPAERRVGRQGERIPLDRII